MRSSQIAELNAEKDRESRLEYGGFQEFGFLVEVTYNKSHVMLLYIWGSPICSISVVELKECEPDHPSPNICYTVYASLNEVPEQQPWSVGRLLTPNSSKRSLNLKPCGGSEELW